MTDWHNPDERESAMAAKWAEAEDKVRVLREALDVALEFAGTVAGGSSWWDEVWEEHQQKIEALEKRK